MPLILNKEVLAGKSDADIKAMIEHVVYLISYDKVNRKKCEEMLELLHWEMTDRMFKYFVEDVQKTKK